MGWQDDPVVSNAPSQPAWASDPIVSDANAPVAVTTGEQQNVADEALLKQAGFTPESETARAAIMPGLDALALNLPTRIKSLYSTATSGGPLTWEEAQRQQAREVAINEAIARRNPYITGTSTAAGLGAGFLTPMGWLGKGATVARGLAEAAGLGAGAAKTAELAGAGINAAGLGAAATGVETGDLGQAAQSGLVSGLVGAGAHGTLGAILPGAVKPAAAGDLQSAIDKVTGKPGQLTPADLPSLAPLAADRGATPEVARQAIFNDLGVPQVTRSMATGEAAPAAASDIAQKATDAAKDIIAQKAATYAGQAPADTAISQALVSKMASEKPLVKAEYQKLEAMGQGATFAPVADRLFMQSIVPQLENAKIPSTAESLADSPYTQTAKAMKFLEDGIGSGNLPLNGPRDVSNYEAVRQFLKEYQRSADPGSKDALGMGKVLDGFDNAYSMALGSFLTSPTDPNVGQKVYQQLLAARSKSADFNERFRPQFGTASREFQSAVNEMSNTGTGQIVSNPTAGSMMAAQKVLTGSLLNDKLGESMYGQLEKAFGTGSTQMGMVDQQIRNQILTPAANKDWTALPAKIDSFLQTNPRISQRVFTGANGQPSVADLRKLSAGIKAINQQPISAPEKSSKIGSMVGYLVKGALVTAGAGHGIIPGALTYGATEGAQKGASAIRSGAARKAELAGAPIARQAPNIPLAVRSPAAYRLPISAVFGQPGEEPGYQAPQPLARKSGGRVSDQLVRAVDRAKKNINKGTEVLLNTPDSHVAHALEVAKRNLEG